MELPVKDLHRFKSLLLELKTGLVEARETGQQAEEVVELDQSRLGRLSRMDAMQIRAISLETGRRQRQYLLKIDAALKRLELGEYGVCRECGEFISSGRLMADPTASLCIGCAQALE